MVVKVDGVDRHISPAIVVLANRAAELYRADKARIEKLSKKLGRPSTEKPKPMKEYYGIVLRQAGLPLDREIMQDMGRVLGPRGAAVTHSKQRGKGKAAPGRSSQGPARSHTGEQMQFGFTRGTSTVLYSADKSRARKV